MHLLEFSTGEVSGEAAEVGWEPETVQSGGNSTELNTFSASGVERWEFFCKDVFTLVVDWRIRTNFGILDESNWADLVAEFVDGSEGQQYEDLDADILRTGGVNAAGAIYSLLHKHTFLSMWI